MTSRYLYSWLALVATSLTLITPSVHGLMAHKPPAVLSVLALSADVAAGHGGAHGSEICNACLVVSQARGSLSTQARTAAAPSLNARLLPPTRIATFSAQFSHVPALPRAPPLALSI